MTDEHDPISQADREAALKYHDMFLFLKDEKKEVRIIEHKYVIRATTGGRVRGLSLDIFKALKLYFDRSLGPGLLVQYVEQARAKIQKMMSENQKHKTMVTLTEDGQLDSDPTQAQGFTAAELEPLKERCRKYWTAPQNKEQYQRLRLGLQTQFYYLTETQLTEAFLSTMKADELHDILRSMVAPRGNGHQHNMNHLANMNQGGADSDEEEETEEEEYTPIIRDEDIATLRSMLPSFTDDELRQALVSANGHVDVAADALLRN